MSELLERRLGWLRDDPARHTLASLRRGIERETLRVDRDGHLARTPHPPGLGSKLTHPYITTDFSEAQPELITPVAESITESLDFLDTVHRVVHHELGDETLWSASMPCILKGEEQVPLAQYGSSNLGQLKTTYRSGLGHRYGRLMQTICAVHYNFSLPPAFWAPYQEAERDRGPLAPFRSARYFDLMRNFRRLSWLPIYLFGASPAVCTSFVQGREHALEVFDQGSLYAPFATSLRNGNLGYQSSLQSDAVRIGYNDLDSYIAGLARAITTPHEPYRRIGVRSPEGYLQVSDAYLQSEAEFYTTIRAKCVPPSGVNFLQVLGEEGVGYVEVRLLDVNPFLPLGIDAEQIRFLDAFLIYCLLEESPPLLDEETRTLDRNVHETVYRGRDPQLTLWRGAQQVALRDWAATVLDRVGMVARLLDDQAGGDAHAAAVAAQRRRAEDPDATISARVLREMREGQMPYFRFAMARALEHQQELRSRPLTPSTLAEYAELAANSFEAQRAIEAGDKIDFAAYLERFAAGYRAVVADARVTADGEP